ncbi:MAG TPA: M50 family metallopeptidase [Pseudonocardia sp.]|nr:M50 family metallopeptidase [Pseudonocardia sp.]
MGEFQEYIPVVGEPVAFAIGFVVLVLVAFTGPYADSIVTVAHEGGHMLALLAAGRPIRSFTLTGRDDRTDGATGFWRLPGGTWVSDISTAFAGYPAPPLLGLGGAYVIADGNAWGVLWIGIVLLLAVLLVESNGLATVITLLILGGVLWATLAGGRTIQAAVAVGLVWLLLIGGLRRILLDGAHASDAHALSDMTWIPRFVWSGIWLVIAAVSLWVGGRLILGYGPSSAVG